MDLSEFRTDTRAINDGVWLRPNEALYGDLEIRTRGFTDQMIDAQAARLAKAAEPYNNDVTRIPNEIRRQINAQLLREFIVLDVRNLAEKGRAITVDEFHNMLADPQFNKLTQSCWDSARTVTTLSAEQLKVAAGNSPAPSAPNSTGVASASA